MSISVIRQFAARAKPDRQAGDLGDFRDALAARRMPRRDHGQERRDFRPQPPMCGDDGGFFTGMRRGRGNDRARADDAISACASVASSTGGGGTSSLRLPVELTRGAPSCAVALGVGGRLGEAKIEPRQQRGDDARHQPPAPERAFRQPAIDHDHRDFAPRRRPGSDWATDRIRRTAPDPAASDRESARHSAAHRAE